MLASNTTQANTAAHGKQQRSTMMSNAALDDRAKVSSANSAPSIRGGGYAVYDPLRQKIGRAERVFVNWNEEPEYIRVRIGFFGLKSVLIPVQLAEVDDERQMLVLK